MSASSQVDTEGKKFNDFLTPELCEEAGIIVINIDKDILYLGAMNLDYIKVKKVVKTIEKEFDLTVNLKQITSLEWETWFENTHAVSVDTIQKKSSKEFLIDNSDQYTYQNYLY